MTKYTYWSDWPSSSFLATAAVDPAPDGRFNISNARFRRSFAPLMEGCPCYTCTHYTQAYLHHVVHAKELIAATLLTIHNEYFIVNLVAQIRQSILDETFYDFKTEFLGRYGSGRLAHVKA